MAQRNKKPVAAEAATTETTGDKATSSRALLALVSRIGTASIELEGMITECALGALKHAMLYDDCVPVQKLYLILPKSQRREALLDWVHVNSPIRIRQKGQVIGMLAEDEQGFTPFDIETATANPFWEKDERKMNPMGDVDMLKQAETALAKLDTRLALVAKDPKVHAFKDGVDTTALRAKLVKQVEALKAAA